MSEIEITEETAEDVKQAVIYAAAIVANIRARLDKFQECFVDDADLLKIWADKPWLSATGNLHERIRSLAKEMRARVEWDDGGNEAHFMREIPVIEVVGHGLN